MSEFAKLGLKNTIKKSINKSNNFSMKQRNHLGIAYIAENGDIFFAHNINNINKAEEINECEIAKDIALVEQLNKTKLQE